MSQIAMLDAPSPAEDVRRTYDRLSSIYRRTVAPFEYKPRMRGIESASIKPQDTVLEVAVGPGLALLEIAKRVDPLTKIYGVDLSPKMLQRAEKTLRRAGYTNIDLREADARHLPFQENTFDVLLNNYMLDLIPLAEIPLILKEFWRVLKPGGKLTLVNMSKPQIQSRSVWELMYRLSPSLNGYCRPVLAEKVTREIGFQEVTRQYIPNLIPSELVTAKKP
jgi:ubiquinone/menaquinone biosynthesis C-methylase UbiE